MSRLSGPRVDAATAEIRVRRMLAVCAAGRILNPKSARSQVIGAMTMGVGAALMEELAVDKRHGFFVEAAGVVASLFLTGLTMSKYFARLAFSCRVSDP